MMGVAQYTLEAPIVKATGGLIVFGKHVESSPEPCLRCGRCVDVCSAGLKPVLIHDYAQNNLWNNCHKLDVASCVECGSCNFTCPSRRPLQQLIKIAKAEIALLKAKSFN